jgi:hypothetical protein
MTSFAAREARDYADFYEKALFVKPTWRLYLVAERICFRPSRAMLLSALSWANSLW